MERLLVYDLLVNFANVFLHTIATCSGGFLLLCITIYLKIILISLKAVRKKTKNLSEFMTEATRRGIRTYTFVYPYCEDLNRKHHEQIRRQVNILTVLMGKSEVVIVHIFLFFF